MAKAAKSEAKVISALSARVNFGKLLQRVEKERHSVVIEKRGRPRAVLLAIQDYVRLATPEPEVLRLIGEESVAKGTEKLTSHQIDKIVRDTRKRTKQK